MRENLADWLGEHSAQVRKLKESIESQQGGRVRRGGEQKKQDKSQERVKPHGPAGEEKPSVSFGKEGARQIPGGTAG